MPAVFNIPLVCEVHFVVSIQAENIEDALAQVAGQHRTLADVCPTGALIEDSTSLDVAGLPQYNNPALLPAPQLLPALAEPYFNVL